MKISRRRFWIYFLLFVFSGIAYIDRVNMSVAAKPIASELGLSPIALGYLFSSFLWAYVLMMLPGGRLTVEDAYAYSKFSRIVLGTNDIDFRARSGADDLAFVEELGVVLVALADNDFPVHRDRVERLAHRVARGPIRHAVIALADEAPGRTDSDVLLRSDGRSHGGDRFHGGAVG